MDVLVDYVAEIFDSISLFHQFLSDFRLVLLQFNSNSFQGNSLFTLQVDFCFLGEMSHFFLRAVIYQQKYLFNAEALSGQAWEWSSQYTQDKLRYTAILLVPRSCFVDN